jgi:signal transduction histidine kinase
MSGRSGSVLVCYSVADSMRLALKSTLAFLPVYLIVVGGVAWWMAAQLQSLSNDMARSTAQLVGGEVARALADSALDQLLRADDETRARLEQIVDEVTQHSGILTSVAVVDRAGTVIAGDNVEVGRRLASPDLIFGSDYSVRLINENRPFGDGSFYMLVPLKAGSELAGYLRLEMRSQRIVHLYARAKRNLALVALAGFVCVVGAGVLLHVQLSRRSQALARDLAGAMRGEVGAPRYRDEFSPALAVARQVGRELNAARGELQQEQQRMVSLLKALDIGVLVLEPDLDLAFANANAAELVGCAGADDLARRWNGEFRGRLAEIPRQVAATLGRRAEVDLPAAGGAPRLKLDFYELGAERCDGYLVLVKSAESLEAIENELGLAIQMRGLNRFYAAFAHDLKAPLNAMVMTLELLKLNLQNGGDDDGARAKQIKHIGVLNEEIRRLDRHVRTLLSHTAPPSPVRQEFDLRALLDDLEALLAPQAKRQKVSLTTRLPEQPMTMVGHADRLKQAILNILINALEAMPGGGTLTIDLERCNGVALLTVRDSGPGIPPALLDAIYDMHFTTKDGGTGVGLYVARSVVQSHDGSIDVHSAPEQGTTFTVTLPL